MAQPSKIQWTDATWNPTAGCSVISPGCKNCYAMRMAWRFEKTAKYAGTVEKVNGKPVWTGRINLDETALVAPLYWRKPRKVFVDSMSDLFHKGVPFTFIDRVFAVMALTPHITYQVLTKRGERMQEFMTSSQAGEERRVDIAYQALVVAREEMPDGLLRFTDERAMIQPDRWPLPNVWLGVSVEDRRQLHRIDDLRKTPAAIRFLSLEPLLEDLGDLDLTGIYWVIVGGESGPGARPMRHKWARSLRDLCQTAGVAFFMKQMSRKAPIPPDLMVRGFPALGPEPEAR